MGIKETFNKFTENFKKKSLKVMLKKISDGTITEEEIIELIVSKKIFKWYKGKQIIDYILLNNIQSDVLDSLATTDIEYAIHYFRYKRFDILGEASSDILLTKIEDATILDYVYKEFLNNPNIPKESKEKVLDNISSHTENDEIIKIAYRNDDFKLALSNETFLLSSSPNNEDNKRDGEQETNLDAIIRKLLDLNQISYLTSIVYSGKTLTYRSKHLNGKTILEYLIDEFKDGIDVYSFSVTTLLQMFDSSCTILDFLIKKDRSIVFNILDAHDNFVKNTRIMQILKANGITKTDDGTPIIQGISLEAEHANEYMFETYKNNYQTASESDVKPEHKAMIEELRKLMMKRGESDIEFVDLACNTFLQLFANKHPYALRDLQFLINIKKGSASFGLRNIQDDDQRFYNQLSNKSAHFKSNNEHGKKRGIYLINPFDARTLNHELGHAFHRCYSDSIPDDFYKFWILDDEKRQKIANFHNQLNAQMQDLEREYELTGDNDNLLFNERLAHYLNKYYESVGSDLKAAAQDDNYPNEYVDYLRKNVLSPEEFATHFRENIKQFRISGYLRFHFADWASLLDIFDALSLGVFFTFGIDNAGTLVETSAGHGIDYYLHDECEKVTLERVLHMAFSEIIAQYAAIIKSPKREELIGILTDIMGMEFVSMLQEYYDNMCIEYNWIASTHVKPMKIK